MPLHQLAVTPADVSGEKLGLALNAPVPAPLVSHRLDHPGGGALLLGVLGASHVVAVEHAFSEEISCTARSFGADLPERAEARAPAGLARPRRLLYPDLPAGRGGTVVRTASRWHP